MFHTHRLLSHFLPRLLCVAVAICALPSGSALGLSPEEQQVANLFSSAPGQRRPFTKLDPILSQVAHARAVDMAKRHYYAHVDPDGHGPNSKVQQAGYELPDWWPNQASANNVESITAGRATAAEAWSSWMGSPSHKSHLLAEASFYADQTSYGVGFYADPASEWGYYWVVITAPPSGPDLTISSPAANAGVAAAQVTIKGSTAGNPAAQVVQYRLENSAGIGSYANASGTTSWTATVTGLETGLNTVRVRSLGANGAVILEAARSFRSVVLTTLEVAVVGSGSVGTGFVGITQRELGRVYSITAKPAAGWLFERWSGGAESTAATIAFTMRHGMTLTANFIPNPFVEVKGAYTGVVQGSTFSPETTGILRVSTTAVGAFSGKLLLDGKTYPVSGKFDLSGHAQAVITRGALAPLTLSLDLDLRGGTERISGSITDGAMTTGFSADRATFSKAAPTPLAGRYTVSLPISDSNLGAAVPQGDGFATLVVTAAGSAKLVGTLADGTNFSQTASLSRDGLLPVYAPLYTKLGSISGALQFRATTVSDLDGLVHWSKPERLEAPFYPQAFVIENPVVGSRYVAPPKGTPVIAVVPAQNNGTLVLGGSDLGPTLSQPVNIETDNRITIPTPLLPNIAVKFSPATGRFSGSFTHPGNGGVRRLNGVVLQKQNAGYGFFLGQSESGYTSLRPAGS